MPESKLMGHVDLKRMSTLGIPGCSESGPVYENSGVEIASEHRKRNEEVLKPIGWERCLDNIMTKFGSLPLAVTMSKVSRGVSMTKDDNTLMNESPLMIVAECDYTVAYVTIFDPHNRSSAKQEAREIPDFMEIRVRPIRQSLPVSSNVVSYRKPNPHLFQLTVDQYRRFYHDEKDEEGYVEVVGMNSDPLLSRRSPGHQRGRCSGSMKPAYKAPGPSIHAIQGGIQGLSQAKAFTTASPVDSHRKT